MAKRGRKNKYDINIKPNLDKIKELASTCTDKDMAKQLNVSVSSFMEWKKTHKEFRDAIQEGRKSLIIELKSKLVEKAFGYKYEEKVEIIGDDGNVKTTTYTKYAHPSTEAINLLLKNYDKENWSSDPQIIDIKNKELKLKEKENEARIKVLDNQANGF